MQRFKSPEQAHQFLSPFGPIYEHFKPRRHLMKATEYRQIMVERFQIWQDVTAVASC
jgi:putative transposase